MTADDEGMVDGTNQAVEEANQAKDILDDISVQRIEELIKNLDSNPNENNSFNQADCLQLIADLACSKQALTLLEAKKVPEKLISLLNQSDPLVVPHALKFFYRINPQLLETKYPQVLGKMFDYWQTRTIEECEQDFEEYCENRVEHFANTKDKHSILRFCIELLNRLQGTTHNLFAGRVMIFLARVLPLFDQSGVNLKSDFNHRPLPDIVVTNMEKINESENNHEKGLSQHVDHDIEEGEAISDNDDDGDNRSDDSADKFDFNKIYEKFWTVQQLLNDPNQIYDKNNWIKFRSNVDTLMNLFERKPANCRVWKLEDSYMSQLRSFSLQLNDIDMRRCFLIQVIFVLQYLDLPVNARPDSLVLDKNQLLWMTSATRKAYDLLDSTPNHKEGREFLAIISHVLQNEKHWNKWKNEKCKEPKRPLEDEDDFINMGSTYQKRRRISDELKNAKPYNMHVIGSQEMTRLWNKRLNNESNTPDLNKYFRVAPEKQLESFKDPNISFRILRLLRKSPHFFVPTAAVIQSIDGYLKSLAEKHFSQ